MLKLLSKKQEGIYRSVSQSVSFSLIPGRALQGAISLRNIFGDSGDPDVLVKCSLFFINLIYFYDESPRSVDVMENAYFVFSRALNLLCHSVFVGALWSRRMDY